MQVRTETSPEDVGGMHAATGILTARGGMTSHAAVVARGWGKCCVSGCSEVRVNDLEKVSSWLFSISKIISVQLWFWVQLWLQVVAIGDTVLREGEWLSLNGSTGEVIVGKQVLSPPALSGDLETFMSWVDDIRKLKAITQNN